MGNSGAFCSNDCKTIGKAYSSQQPNGREWCTCTKTKKNWHSKVEHVFKQQQRQRWQRHFNLNESQKHHFAIRDHAFLLTINGCNYFQVHIEIVCHCSCLLLKRLTSALFSIFMHFISNSTVSIYYCCSLLVGVWLCISTWAEKKYATTQCCGSHSFMHANTYRYGISTTKASPLRLQWTTSNNNKFARKWMEFVKKFAEQYPNNSTIFYIQPAQNGWTRWDSPSSSNKQHAFIIHINENVFWLNVSSHCWSRQELSHI